MHKMVIPSKLTELTKVQETVIGLVQKHGFNKDEVFAVRLALDEAVSNAIVHGNKNDPAKKVTIQYDVDDETVRIDVSDQGCGFCPENLPDPTLEENLASPRGRGVMLIEAYMTEVHYNKKGNRISMLKRKGCPLPKKK